MRPRRMDRRTFLRGAGTLLALPWLEGLSRAGLLRREPPQRLAFLFVPNGVVGEHWFPPAEGDFLGASSLEPLRPHRDSVSLFTGLAHRNGMALGDGPGDHARAAASFLTGAHPRKTAGPDLHNGISVDQVAARHLGRSTRFPSLELGIEPGRLSGGCDSGYSCAYSSNISWSSPETPVPKETRPRLLFDRLLGMQDAGLSEEQRRLRRDRRRSVLDFVQEDARRLRGTLGSRDRGKLDQYFDSVREVERRLVRQEDLGRWAETTGVARPADPPPADHGEHVHLMTDLLALAFQLDLTRVATFMIADAGSNRSYPDLGVPDGHHELSHHGDDPTKLEKLARINRHHADLLARFLERLAATEAEEGGRLLDSCAVVFGSSLGDGNRHNHDDLPILVAGGGAGHRGGRWRAAEPGTPLCNLYLSLLHGTGMAEESFGDSSGPLTEWS